MQGIDSEAGTAIVIGLRLCSHSLTQMRATLTSRGPPTGYALRPPLMSNVSLLPHYGQNPRSRRSRVDGVTAALVYGRCMHRRVRSRGLPHCREPKVSRIAYARPGVLELEASPNLGGFRGAMPSRQAEVRGAVRLGCSCLRRRPGAEPNLSLLPGRWNQSPTSIR